MRIVAIERVPAQLKFDSHSAPVFEMSIGGRIHFDADGHQRTKLSALTAPIVVSQSAGPCPPDARG